MKRFTCEQVDAAVEWCMKEYFRDDSPALQFRYREALNAEFTSFLEKIDRDDEAYSRFMDERCGGICILRREDSDYSLIARARRRVVRDDPDTTPYNDFIWFQPGKVLAAVSMGDEELIYQKPEGG